MKTLAHSRRLSLALLCAAGLSLTAGAVHASQLDSDLLRLTGSAAHVGKVDPYTDGAFGKRDPYTDGAFGPRSPYTDGARGEHVSDARDRFSQGA